jgi:hypothetical protein
VAMSACGRAQDEASGRSDCEAERRTIPVRRDHEGDQPLSGGRSARKPSCQQLQGIGIRLVVLDRVPQANASDGGVAAVLAWVAPPWWPHGREPTWFIPLPAASLHCSPVRFRSGRALRPPLFRRPVHGVLCVRRDPWVSQDGPPKADSNREIG